MSLKEFVDENSCVFSVFACMFLTLLYVGSLYVWRTTHTRDHPSTIKRRFFSVLCVMCIAPVCCQYFLTEESLKRGSVYEHFGLRTVGLLKAAIYPLTLTAIFFLGPITMQFLSGIWKLYLEPVYWLQSWQDLVWVRNNIMAPLSEEWVFRACMMPLLLQCLAPITAVFVGPLLFGVDLMKDDIEKVAGKDWDKKTHFHHMLELMKLGIAFPNALCVSSFQFTYTSLFGAYSAYLFVRTGHFVAPLLAHMFCNHMGFPNFGEICEFPILQRLLIIASFVVGIVLWSFLLTRLTDPEIYDNKLHWHIEFNDIGF